MSWLLQTMFKKIFFKQCFIPKTFEEITGQTLILANVNSRILTLLSINVLRREYKTNIKFFDKKV